jgi:hypothetical protein
VVGAALYESLSARQADIEQAVLARVSSVGPPSHSTTPSRGLRDAVSAAVDYGLSGLERENSGLAIPVRLLTQARLAAQESISFDTVSRRYLAGYTVFTDFILDEVQQRRDIDSYSLKLLMQSQVASFDHLLNELSTEYVREAQSLPSSPGEALAKRVRRLLSGESLDTSSFAYDFKSRHVGAVVSGTDAPAAIRALAKELGIHFMVVQVGEEISWGWLDVRPVSDWDKTLHTILTSWPRHIPMSLGEPAENMDGWRLTHRQASAAFPVAAARACGVARYSDVALLASMMRDELLVTYLRNLYLTPLAHCRHEGTALKETLRAYFAAGCNGASAAAALGVSRQTIANRLQAVERQIGSPVRSCARDLEAALRLEEVVPVHS